VGALFGVWCFTRKRSTVERAFDEYTTWMGKELKLVSKEKIMVGMK